MTTHLTRKLVRSALLAALFTTLFTLALLPAVAVRAQAQQTPAQTQAQSGGTVGGFRTGDRIALTIEGPTTITDTLVVREGESIQIPSIGTISLQGVKRAEIQTYLSTEIQKYVKNANVRAVPLIRLGILGDVVRPGYYSMPADLLLTDALMMAGGPSPNGDVNKSVIKRGTQNLYSSSQFTKVLQSGATVDDARLASGDQIVVMPKQTNGLDFLARATGLAAAFAAIIAVVH